MSEQLNYVITVTSFMAQNTSFNDSLQRQSTSYSGCKYITFINSLPFNQVSHDAMPCK